jgi:hypothetical protein
MCQLEIILPANQPDEIAPATPSNSIQCMVLQGFCMIQYLSESAKHTVKRHTVHGVEGILHD